MEKICKNCEHFYGKSYLRIGDCYRVSGRGILTWPDNSCIHWEKTTTPPISWKRLKEDFDCGEDCTIVVPSFYSKNRGNLSGKVSEATVYIYKAVSGEFYCPYEDTIEYIPFDDMLNVWYVNLDEIFKPWEES